MTATLTETFPAAAADLLRTAHEVVSDHSAGVDDDLAQAAMHLITCAADVVALLPRPDLHAAREALGCARAAVVAASYAVTKIHDGRPRS
jgi:hypothetical protein